MARAPRVLIVAYFFPPSGGAGVQRPLQWVKYLAQRGWALDVLTVQDGDYFAEDHSLSAEVPERARVLRTWSMEAGRLRPLRAARRSQGRQVGTAKRSGIIRALQAARPYLLVPDPQVGWLPFAVERGLRAMLGYDGPTVILTTSTPFTSHLVGWTLKRLTGAPWIADFRDAWVGNPHRRSGFAGVDRALEARIVQGADHVITTCPTVTQLLQRHRPNAPDRFSTIYNGYDPALFEGRSQVASPGRTWELLHTGVLYGSRDPGPFLQGLAHFVRSERPQVRVRLVGQLDRQRAEQLRALIERLELSRVIELVPYQPHETILQWLHESHLLLLLSSAGAESRLEIPGKLYEYLAARREILALIGEGPAADIIAECGAGRRVSPDDPQAIASALAKAYRAHQRGASMRSDPEKIAKYARTAQVETLDRLLRETLERADVPR